MRNKYTLEETKKRINESSAFLFDFDGTLVNLDKLNLDAFSLVFKEMYDLDFTRGEFMKYISGRGSKNGLVEYLGVYGIKDFSSEEINSRFYEHKNGLMKERLEEEIYLLPGIEEFLEYYKDKKKRNIVVTSSREYFVEDILTHFGIFKYFEKVFDRFMVVRGKPAPEAFNRAIEYIGIEVGECIAFEDSFYGLQSAKGANLFTIGILNKGWNDDFVYALADYVVDDYSKLIK